MTLWTLLSYLPGTPPHRQYRETLDWQARALALCRAFWGPDFPEPPLPGRRPEELRLCIDSMLGVLHTTAAATRGASHDEVMAVFDEHRAT